VNPPHVCACIMRLIGFSPYSNRNLLTRSEVVALINTLHRFAESLHAVNLFRGMWAAEYEPHSINDVSHSYPSSDDECLMFWTDRIHKTLSTDRKPPNSLVGIL